MQIKNSKSPGPLKVILVAGLVAGTLDILAAFVQTYINTRKGPDIVLKYIASGVFGRKEAFGGGDSMIIWGLLFHFIIAMAFAAFFCFSLSKLETRFQEYHFIWITVRAFCMDSHEQACCTPKQNPFSIFCLEQGDHCYAYSCILYRIANCLDHKEILSPTHGSIDLSTFIMGQQLFSNVMVENFLLAGYNLA